MTRAVWMSSAAVAVFLMVGWAATVTMTHSPKLRSNHSVPSLSVPPLVTVTEQGKLFHRADCAYIHGPPRSEAGEQAIAEGYTACTRCMKVKP